MTELDKAIDALARERRRLEEHLATMSVHDGRAMTRAFAVHAEIEANEKRTQALEARAGRDRVTTSATDALGSLFTTPETLGDLFDALEEHDDGTASTSSTSGPPADDFTGNPDEGDLRAIFG